MGLLNKLADRLRKNEDAEPRLKYHAKPTSRRALLFGLGAAAVVIGGGLAEANTPFTTFPFAATGSATTRTDPARWGALHYDVKDFGAVGNGSIDDTAAVQAAVDAASASGSRAIIFFPAGNYLLSSSVTVNNSPTALVSIIFQGVGNASSITGTFNDFLIRRDGSGINNLTDGVRVFEYLTFTNGHATGGCVKWNANIGSTIHDCIFNGNRGLDVSFCQGTTVANCKFATSNTYNSVAITIGENGVINSCDVTGFQIGIAFSGVGVCIFGGRYELNAFAMSCGNANDGVPGDNHASGFCILGGSFESNGIAIDLFGGCGNFQIGGFQIIGFESANTRYSGVNVSSTTFTGATSGATATASSITSNILTIGGTVTGTFQIGERVTGSGVPSGTVIFAQISGTSGKAGTYSLKGICQYGIRIPTDNGQNGTFNGIACNPQAQIAGISIANSTNRANLIFQGCSVANTSTLGGTTWVLPTKAHTANWLGCDIQPTFLFAGLPTGGNVRASDTYYITDGNQATAGMAVTTGGGSNKSFVTYDGAAWIRGAA